MTHLTTVDKFGLVVGGGLVVLGVVVIGLLEMALGVPHPVSGEGQIVHETLVPITVRSGIILLGLLTWAGTAMFRVVRPGTPAERPTSVPSRD